MKRVVSVFGPLLVILVLSAPAEAAFPGANGRIAFTRDYGFPTGNVEIFTIESTGTGETNVTNESQRDYQPTWSPDGQKIAFFVLDPSEGIWMMNSDGSGRTPVVSGRSDPAWAPDATRIAFGEIGVINVDGTDRRFLQPGESPHWSPDGGKIAFSLGRCLDTECDGVTEDLWMMNADGSGATKLSDDAIPLDWKPDGTKLLINFFGVGNPHGNYLINRDGTGWTPFTATASSQVVFSPDGQKVAFTKTSVSTQSDIYTAKLDGTDLTQVTSTPEEDAKPTWQPLPGSSPPPPYPTPKLAAPIRASFVPVFQRCGTPGNPANRSHSPPLSVGSCNPQFKGAAHFGPQAKGTAWIAPIYGDTNPANGDQADLAVRLDLSDVQTAAGGDYNPSPTGADGSFASRIRLTDRAHGGSGTDPGTMVDWDFLVTFNCTATSDPGVGSDCRLDTTADAVIPGMIKENKAMVLQVFRMRLNDSGPNSVRGDGDDKLFAQEGVFIP